MEVTYNQVSDLVLFGLVLLSVGSGWIVGYSKGANDGYTVGCATADEEAADQHPIINIGFEETEVEDQMRFYDVISGTYLMTGTLSECTDFVSKNRTSETHVIYSKMSAPTDE